MNKNNFKRVNLKPRWGQTISIGLFSTKYGILSNSKKMVLLPLKKIKRVAVEYYPFGCLS